MAVHPRHLRRALELFEAEPGRAWTLHEVASTCGTRPRTLQKHFRRFVGQTPLQYLRDLRLERARREMLEGRNARVAEVASSYGFTHLGRFAAQYRERFGETPSATLQGGKNSSVNELRLLPPLSTTLERPAVAVLPFHLVGVDARYVGGMGEGIAAAILRLRWLVVSTPSKARYHLRGKVRADADRRLRATVMLLDVSTGRILWADEWDGNFDSAFEFEDRVALRVARAIEPALREAELQRARRVDPERLTAWDLTIRALPTVLSYDADAQARALEFLERAMELAPEDPLPVSLAAWCHGVRGCLRFTARPGEEKEAAQQLAGRAAMLNAGDALAQTALAAAYTLAHDLTTATVHAERALALDGGSAWAWGRSGWLRAYCGEREGAIERFHIARAIAPADAQSAMCCFGIAAGHMQSNLHAQAITWMRRGIAEGPRTVAWMNAFLASACALENRKEEARRRLAEWRRAYPDVTIADVRAGLPFDAALLDRIAEGLEAAGLRGPC